MAHLPWPVCCAAVLLPFEPLNQEAKGAHGPLRANDRGRRKTQILRAFDEVGILLGRGEHYRVARRDSTRLRHVAALRHWETRAGPKAMDAAGLDLSEMRA